MSNSLLDDTGSTIYGEKFLLKEAKSLIEFARGSEITSGGFGYLNSQGKVDSSQPRQAYVQCRMIQVFGLTHLMGLQDSSRLIKHGVDALNDLFFDQGDSGFFNAIDSSGKPIGDSKLGYDHMFVLLGAITATAAGVEGASKLLQRAENAIDRFFWDSEFEMMNDQWDLEFTTLSGYRGINVNMHAVEALTAAFDLTKDDKYLDRALAICRRTINEFARNNHWLLPEHFTSNWKPELEFNHDNPADQFRPYGVTIGHLFEWSRLVMQVGLLVKDQAGYEWIEEGARKLYEHAKKYGWDADNSPGFIYTMDWQMRPVVHSRMHWVAAEAVMAAYVLWKMTGEEKFLIDYDLWWSFIDRHVIDREFGSWHHELNSQLQVIETTWPGKPDIYHALNACLLPLLPFQPSFIGSVTSIEVNGM
ncbi:MAG: N-acylglucosamine 2-epimerase [Actinobacteria bacterium]|jgi:mannose/cellobiose epimerase-like protein (N-acyl-D-glucosamine 2-epimerase family)|nr:N-acylglucosamine 2-epimerase [Actinomycetota bacterium]